MGADLYIRDLPKENQYTGFRTSVNAGYFRDSYNNWNLLWQYGLDYWVAFKKYLDEEGLLTPQGAQELLDELKKREVVFQGNMALMLIKKNPVWDYDRYNGGKIGEPTYRPEKITLAERKDAVKWYIKHAKELKAFLRKAIKLNSPIECSI